MKTEGLRLLATIPTAPTTLYLAWLSSEQHSAMTGSVAKIDATVGGKYTAANGYVSGKIVVLDLGRRIVMSWRTTDFPREAGDSRVEVHFESIGGSTRVLILHTEIPEGLAEKSRSVWVDSYFNPMRAHFSKYLPDPRKPPPPRRPAPPEEEEPEEQQASPTKKGKLGKEPPPVKGGAPTAPASGKKLVQKPTAKAPAKIVPPAKKAPPPKPAPAAKKALAKKAPPKAPPKKAAPAKKAPAKKPAPKAAKGKTSKKR